MGLFKRDLIRSFVLGFALTAAAICAAMGTAMIGSANAGVMPSAEAAPAR
jgi:hypothetical protein